MMMFETQVVLRSTDPEQLAEDVRAISEFIQERRSGATRPTASRDPRPHQNQREHAHLSVVSG
jgi:hypothetical protein